MTIKKPTFVLALTLFSMLLMTVSPAGEGPHSKVITFDAPGAGTASGQGTRCLGAGEPAMRSSRTPLGLGKLIGGEN